MDDIGTALLALEAWACVVPEPRPERLPQMTNPIWRVAGTDDRRFVLKRLPEFPPGVGPVDEFRVLCYLQEHDVPVALPIVTDAGSIHHTVGDERYALLPYLRSSNDNHELGPAAAKTAQAIGAAIGHLESVLAGCPWDLPSYVDDPGPQILGDQLLALPIDDVRPVMPIVDQLWAAVSDLPIQRTHGDCNTGNVLVHEGRVTGFIDLDHLPIGPRVRDLSYYLASRVRRHLCDPDTADRDLAAIQAVLGDYLTGFHEACPLSDHERSAVVPLMLLAQIGFTDWSRHGRTPNAEHYRQGVTAIAWIVANLERLTAAAGTPVQPKP